MSDNTRIAKNAVFLYIRMFISMAVGLYTSRVVLDILGAEDYGIYGVVGGILTMLHFINASMSNSTSRFINYEMGKGDLNRISQTFSAALNIHIGLALIIFLIAETIGLWFLCNKLVIPPERMHAAHVVYQISIISAMLGITQAPYGAIIISNEKMDIFAYFELLNVSLKLLIVYLLVIGNFDKLILYACLNFAISVLMMTIYRVYCIKHFKASHYRWYYEKKMYKNLISFSTQNMYANMAFSFRQQGTSFILNMLFGPLLNAANSIAATVSGIITAFAHNIHSAFRPQIVQQYAAGNYKRVNTLIMNSAKYSTILLLFIVIPLEFETPYVLSLWLKEVPSYCVPFTRLTLISLLTAITTPVHAGLTATGNIKSYSYFQGTIYLIAPFVSYFLCRFTSTPEIAYIVIISSQLIAVTSLIFFFKKQYSLFSLSQYGQMVCTVVAITIITVLAIYALHCIIKVPSFRLITEAVVTVFVLGGLTFLTINREDRMRIIAFAKSKLNKQ